MKPITVRISDLLHAEITKRAELDKRSVNATVGLLLESALGQPTQAVSRAPVASLPRRAKQDVTPRFKAGVLPKATKGSK